MAVPWSLTTTAPQRIDTTIGSADDHDAAVTAVLFAAQGAIAAELSATPAARYELRAADELVALIQTGADEDGRPDYPSTSGLVQRIEYQRYLSAAPY
jgi:hypothetical protein